MADPIVVTCPQCKKQLKAPAELAGKKVKCKCGATLEVKAGKAAAKAAPAKAAAAPAKAAAADSEAPAIGFAKDDPPATPPAKEAPAKKKAAKADDAKAKKAAADAEFNDSNPYGVTETDLVPRCPNCAKELESEDAVICLHCGYNTRTRSHIAVKRVYEPNSSDRLAWLMPGILCVVGIVALAGITGYVVLGMDSTWNDMDESVGTKSLSRGLRTWGVAMSLWAMWIAAKIAYNRLILNPRPPEEEK